MSSNLQIAQQTLSFAVALAQRLAQVLGADRWRELPPVVVVVAVAALLARYAGRDEVALLVQAPQTVTDQRRWTFESTATPDAPELLRRVGSTALTSTAWPGRGQVRVRPTSVPRRQSRRSRSAWRSGAPEALAAADLTLNVQRASR